MSELTRMHDALVALGLREDLLAFDTVWAAAGIGTRSSRSRPPSWRR